MAKYTTEVRSICETNAGSLVQEGASVDEIIEASKASIFNFDFPVFEETYRGIIETKILKHYYTREIGLETVGLWKLKLNTALNEIMPYYNQLYESTLLQFNPFYDVDYTRKHTGTATTDDTISRTETKTNTKTDQGTQSATNTNVVDGTTVDKFSDTPQGSIDLMDVSANAYLTNLRKVDNDTTTTDNGSLTHSSTVADTGSNTVAGTNGRDFAEAFTEEIKGKMGTQSYAKLLKEFRETFLNIDELLVNDEKIQRLFMKLW